jgi:hypothetical protein
MQYGLPYKGNKSAIVHRIYDVISANHNLSDITFVDMFGGGGSVSHYFSELIMDRPNKVIYNEYNEFLYKITSAKLKINRSDAMTKTQFYEYVKGKDKNIKSDAIVLLQSALHRSVNFRYREEVFSESLFTHYMNIANRYYSNTIDEFCNMDFVACYKFNAAKHSNIVLYCDPPYFETTGYYEEFDYNRFVKFINKVSKIVPVYISEYCVHPDLIKPDKVYKFTKQNHLGKDRSKKITELLMEYIP